MMAGSICWMLVIVTVGFSTTAAIRSASRIAPEKRLFFPKYAPMTKTTGNNISQLQLSPAENQSLTTINFFRAVHQVPPVAWDAQLARQALSCANSLVAEQNLLAETPDCPSQGTSRGFSRFSNAAAGSRDAILKSWYDESRYVLPENYFRNPTEVEGAEGYLQMIWRSSTKVGCGYSGQATDTLNPLPSDNPADPPPFYVFACVWTPTGGQPSNAFPQNIQAPIG